MSHVNAPHALSSLSTPTSLAKNSPHHQKITYCLALPHEHLTHSFNPKLTFTQFLSHLRPPYSGDMAAVLSSSLSTSLPTLNYKNPNKRLLVLPYPKIASLQISHVYANNECLLMKPVFRKWRVSGVSADVAQDEVAVEAGEGDVAVEEEEKCDEVNTKLYIGNLPYLCDSAQLAGIVQDYATPELVEVLYDRVSGRSRGFAFVTMSSIEDCNLVIENLDGSLYGGRPLRVNFSDKPKPKMPLYPETEYKLFVGNLSWSASSEALTQAFSQFGDVVGARVLYDGETGKSRGYGFVSYATQTEMDAALAALDGVELEGRAMRVSLAQGKRS